MEPTNPMTPQQPVGPERPGMPAEPVQPVEPVRPTRYYAPVPSPSYRLRQVIYFVLGIIEALLLIRVVLKLLAANPYAPFASFMYNITGPLVVFFQGVFPEPQSNGSVLDLAALLAMAIYALLAWAIIRAIQIIRHRQPTPTA